MAKKLFTICYLVFFGISYSLGVTPVPALGLVVSNRVSMDGVLVPSGTTLLPNTTLKTIEDPAFVHLERGQILRFDRGSSAYFERNASGDTKVTVRSGTVAFRTANAETWRVGPDSVILFTPEGAVTNSQQVAVILAEPAQAGSKIIVVNDTLPLEAKKLLLLQSPDGQIREIHFIESFSGNQVTLTAPLQNSFPANSALIQDVALVQAAMAGGVSVVGAAGGASAGATLPGVVAPTAAGAGLSTGAIVGIVVAAAVGGTVAAVAIGGEEKEVSP